MANPLIEQATQKTSVGAGLATAGMGAWMSENWALVIGLVLSVVSLGMSFYFKCRQEKREQERMKMSRDLYHKKMQRDDTE